MSRSGAIKMVLKASALKELRKLDRSGDEISRQMSDRARKLLKDEPVEQLALRVNFY
ncbi:hypothetical protein [Pseudomonas sp. MF6776]|uniref:hypothetical protein n=1 Tax=Pseudomonas sp. MF6776 TaxID=2797534 RepID=UPI00190DE9D6|nr:hypothetical protein [Pseudomonas sp. MF6776]MBK3468179.1 hypothetical protein [Pseudomonas sp. MF6776]